MKKLNVLAASLLLLAPLVAGCINDEEERFACPRGAHILPESEAPPDSVPLAIPNRLGTSLNLEYVLVDCDVPAHQVRWHVGIVQSKADPPRNVTVQYVEGSTIRLELDHVGRYRVDAMGLSPEGEDLVVHVSTTFIDLVHVEMNGTVSANGHRFESIVPMHCCPGGAWVEVHGDEDTIPPPRWMTQFIRTDTGETIWAGESHASDSIASFRDALPPDWQGFVRMDLWNNDMTATLHGDRAFDVEFRIGPIAGEPLRDV